MNFSVVIATYKRPEALRDTLESIFLNTVIPTEIIIIDDDVTTPELLEHFNKVAAEKSISFTYHKKDHSVIRQGLSESKNLGAKMATEDIVFYLDDDVILNKNYFTEIVKVWEQNKNDTELAGVGGRISNNRKTGRLEKIYLRLFGLTGDCSWDVNEVGFQVWDESVVKTEKSYYMHGGVSSYRKEVLLAFPFATFSGGRTGLEDVEHSLRLKNDGKYLFYVPSAHLTHHPAEGGREAQFLSGVKESQNRKAIFTQLCKQDLKHRVWFVWSNIGWIKKKILSFNWIQALGMMKGFFLKSK